MSIKTKIAITGVECSGKTTLCNELCKYYNTEYVEEYARTYLEALNREYNQKDLLAIAEKQQEIQNELCFKNNITIFDTDASVIKIWSEVKYGNCDAAINNILYKNLPNVYLLPHFDIPYEYDPLRETNSVEERENIFFKYIQLLNSLNINYAILEGTQEERVKEAIEFIDGYLLKGK